MSIKTVQGRPEQQEKQRLKLDGSVFGEFIKYRLENNRDAKIIITSRSSTTGLGKSTLAILIAEWIHRTQGRERWKAKENAFISVNDYIQAYLNSEPGNCLILDEVEAGADNRRAMSHENVNLSKAWATLRYKNVISIATLPTTSMVDSRLLELSDIWINVMSRGLAMPYFIWINDFTGEMRRIPVREPESSRKEIIHWDSIENSENFKYLSKLKDTDVFGKDSKKYDYSEVQNKKEKAAKEKRDKIIKRLYENTNLSQNEIGKLVEEDGLRQQTVSQILNEK